jgi:hypothetical protein
MTMTHPHVILASSVFYKLRPKIAINSAHFLRPKKEKEAMTPWHSHSLTHHALSRLSLSHTHSLTIKRLSNTLTKGGSQEIKKLIQHSNSNYSLQNLSHPILVEDDTVSAVYKDVIQDLL